MSIHPIRGLAHPLRSLHRAIMDILIKRLAPTMVLHEVQTDIACTTLIEFAGRRCRIVVAPEETEIVIRHPRAVPNPPEGACDSRHALAGKGRGGGANSATPAAPSTSSQGVQ